MQPNTWDHALPCGEFGQRNGPYFLSVPGVPGTAKLVFLSVQGTVSRSMERYYAIGTSCFRCQDMPANSEIEMRPGFWWRGYEIPGRPLLITLQQCQQQAACLRHVRQVMDSFVMGVEHPGQAGSWVAGVDGGSCSARVFECYTLAEAALINGPVYPEWSSPTHGACYRETGCPRYTLVEALQYIYSIRVAWGWPLVRADSRVNYRATCSGQPMELNVYVAYNVSGSDRYGIISSAYIEPRNECWVYGTASTGNQSFRVGDVTHMGEPTPFAMLLEIIPLQYAGLASSARLDAELTL